LLVLSRFDYKEVQWVKEKADLGLLLVDVLHQVEHACREKDVSLAVTLPEESCQVFLDKDKIRQVLLNLLENAYKFTPAGGEITIRVFPGDECSICVAICDTGAGIPPADQERVFERFYRVDKTRSRASGGTGLGLPIAKQIIEAHGGKITLKSKPGEGTEMQFCLPVNGNHDCAGKKNSKA